MTNKSFLFSCRGQRYIIRIPGEGTQRLIDRKQEAETYRIVEGLDICDEVVYINPENGYKMTEGIRAVTREGSGGFGRSQRAGKDRETNQ